MLCKGDEKSAGIKPPLQRRRNDNAVSWMGRLKEKWRHESAATQAKNRGSSAFRDKGESNEKGIGVLSYWYGRYLRDASDGRARQVVGSGRDAERASG